ncbi:MAG: GntR family transcriptional regulator, partial [Firmicutes bacterium]|nr:GntR family transcriptional regulator [Bacillota bacterium]
MLISLDMTGEEPLYLQLRNAIVLAIGSKRLR